MKKFGTILMVGLATMIMLTSTVSGVPILAAGGGQSMKKANKAITGTELLNIVNNLSTAQGKKVYQLDDVSSNRIKKPNESVTREDAVTLLFKVFGFEAQKGAWTTFKDTADIQKHAIVAVNMMYEKDIILGHVDGTFKPLKAITRAEIEKIMNRASQIGYLADLSDGIAANNNITLIKETRPFGEVVYAMTIKYDESIDGSKLKASDFAVEAILGKETAARTITKVYTNDSAATAATSKTGNYVIIELDTTKDTNAGTMYYDMVLGRNILYKLNYYVTQLATITADNGNKIAAGTKQQSGSEVNAVVDRFKADTYTSEAGNKIDYRLYEPKTEIGKKYPLVIFLHGNGERGPNGVTQLIANAGGTVWASDENQANNPSFVLAPQNPLVRSGLWLDKNVYETTLELIKSAASNPLIDTNRIYITGVSMGGFGTWGFLQRNPDLFAAAMPVCGGGDLTKVEAIKDIPIWAFHAADDPVVKVSGEIPLYMPEFMIHGTRDMVNALKALGDTEIKYTEYEPGYVAMPLAPMAHFSWIPAYKTQEAIDWMFKQSK
jgi:predicted peptidase